MKIKLTIHPELPEEQVTIQARNRRRQIDQLVNYIQSMNEEDRKLKVKKGDRLYMLEVQTLYRLFIENKVLHLETEKERFTSAARLYQAKEELPSYFLQISQSEIINIRQVASLQLTGNGLVKIMLKNGTSTYSSRRYLKSIKEAFAL